MKRSPWLPTALAAAYALVVVPLGIILWTRAISSLPDEGTRTLQLVHDQILEEYVDEIDSEKLFENAAKGMVGELDEYSAFIEPEKAEEFDQTQLNGVYTGIGVLLTPSGHQVLSPLPGGPAERAGVEAGDKFVRVAGDVASETERESNQWLQERLLGREGEQVAVAVERDGAVVELDIDRGSVSEAKVGWAHVIDAERKIGYVAIRGFQRQVVEQFDQALDWLAEDAEGSLGGLIIDLRGNRGGLLDAAIAMTNRFLPEGRIVSQVGRKNETEVHDANPELCVLPALPLVILVDRDTASASELMAAALQDHDRAQIVGERSYGKGAVQSVYSWEDRPFRLKLTTSLYFPPSGRVIDKNYADDGRGGVIPDIPVEVDQAIRILTRRAIARREVPRQYREQVLAAGMALPPPPTPEDDPQLAAALAAF